jgi:branched-chain amino acid transport system permease protein
LTRTHLKRAVIALLAALAGLLLLSGSPAHAQEDGLVIRAQVRDQQRDAAGRADNQPVAGVTITVVDADGNEIASGVTDADGVVLLPVPARADYVVSLDEDTLPDGLGIAANSLAEQTVTQDSFTTTTKIVNFFTGESQSFGQTGIEKLAQRLADGIRLGLVIAMCSVGLSLIFGTTGLTNFAHGELVTFGALVAFLLNVTGIGFLAFLGFLPLIDDDGRFQLFLAVPIAVAVGGAFGWLNDWVIFARLRKRGIGLITQMVVTVGLSIMLRNLFLFQFGGRTRPLRNYSLQEGVDIGPITITPRDLVTAAISLVVLIAVASTLQYTRIGKAVRAVSDNPDLASATGINSQQVIRLVWITAGSLAALGGIFRALDEQVGFDMGSRLLFLMFAGITLGGLGSAYGALVGGFLVGVLVELATFVVPSELKNTPALLILIFVLLIRPQGILGRAERVG